MIVLHINVGNGSVKEKEYEVTGAVELGIKVHEEKRTFKDDPLKKNAFVMGKGPLTDLGLPGTHRLTFVFRSPLTGGIHISSMGGAAWYFKRTGVDGIIIEGKAEEPSVISIHGSKEGYDIAFFKFENVIEEMKKGVRSIAEKIASFVDFPSRAVLTGLASITTPFGALYSADMKDGKVVGGSEDYAARGGGGSALFQAHNIIGIAFGGDPIPLKLDQEAKKIVEKVHEKDYMQAVLDATKKYRYDPHLNTGGTFGGNYPHLQVYTPMFNFGMIYMSKEERERYWKELMGQRWWARFNKEVIDVRAFKTCGEPCPVACKKVWKDMKVDYEPFEACGPLSWIFDFDQAARVVNAADAFGYDAIEFGSIFAWMLESVKNGLIPARDLGFSGRFESKEIADFGIKFAMDLVIRNNEIYRALREGKRRGGEILNELYGKGIKDLAVYVPYGNEGYMTPTMYWAIGNYVPLPVPGRYWTFYKFAVFLEPEELAEKSFSRAIAEMWLDNLGICRFHRGWFEKAMPPLLEHKGMHIDIASKGREIIKHIVEYNRKAKAMPEFWDSKRVKDIIAIGAKDFGNEAWARKFEKNKEEALHEYWNAFHAKFYSLLEGEE